MSPVALIEIKDLGRCELCVFVVAVTDDGSTKVRKIHKGNQLSTRRRLFLQKLCVVKLVAKLLITRREREAKRHAKNFKSLHEGSKGGGSWLTHLKAAQGRSLDARSLCNTLSTRVATFAGKPKATVAGIRCPPLLKTFGRLVSKAELLAVFLFAVALSAHNRHQVQQATGWKNPGALVTSDCQRVLALADALNLSKLTKNIDFRRLRSFGGYSMSVGVSVL